MVPYVIDIMIFLGSALMVYNIYGFVRFAGNVRKKKTWGKETFILYFPILLLVFFLAGYVIVGLFGKPDLLMAGILFGGSIFVFVMYWMLSGIVRRLTENEHLEAELLAAEKSSNAKTNFLASISHEMRTPMNVIQGMDTMALKNPNLPAKTREQLEKIGHSARHLSGLIANILDMQEMDTGKQIIHRAVFSMQDALEQINAVISVACEEKGLAYETSFAPCVYQDYTGDAMQLKRALMNLLDNAVKFTDPPGIVRFTVSWLEEGDTSEERVFTSRDMVFTISDTGIGIDEEFLPNLFQPFTQEDMSFTNRFGGSGTGLSAAHSIVTRMGGRIEVSSRKGEGSTFTAIIPVMPALKEKPEEGESAPQSGQMLESLEGCHILVVEDIPENAEIVSDLLELEGARITCVENGLEAVDTFRDSEPDTYDAILMDLRMPVMDGLEAAAKIRSLPRADAGSVPIIALTANAFESDVRNSLNAGMNGHLSKPIDPDLLYTELKRWIWKHKAEGSCARHDSVK